MAATSRRLPATTINIHGGGSTVYKQRSAGLSSTSSLLLSHYSIRSSHASDSNEDESTSSATPRRTRSFQSSTLGRANNSNQSPPISLNYLFMKSLTNLTLKVNSPLPMTIITLLILAASDIELLLSWFAWRFVSRWIHSKKSTLSKMKARNRGKTSRQTCTADISIF